MMWLLVLPGLFMVGYGFYQLALSKEELWRRQEGRFRAQGITNRERTPEWERAQDVASWSFVACGVALMLFGLFMGASKTGQKADELPQSGLILDGKHLSREEAERKGLGHFLDSQKER